MRRKSRRRKPPPRGKIVIDCGDISLDDRESLEKKMEEFVSRIGSCNVRYYQDAQALIDAGTAKSFLDAARRIAQQTGETTEAVRQKAIKGRSKVVPLEQFSSKLRDHRVKKLERKLEETHEYLAGKQEEVDRVRKAYHVEQAVIRLTIPIAEKLFCPACIKAYKEWVSGGDGVAERREYRLK